MKEIIFNLAMLEAINFCKEHGIDCSGTYLQKAPRGYTYALCKVEGGEVIMTTTLHKSSVPTHTVNKDQIC